jgi:hypothetical protein
MLCLDVYTGEVTSSFIRVSAAGTTGKKAGAPDMRVHRQAVDKLYVKGVMRA